MTTTPLENWIAGKIGGSPEPNTLRAYQLQKLRETLRLVQNNSRFYKEHLRGFNPDSFKHWDDLKKLPFTYPADIAEDPNGFLCVSPRDIGRIVTLNTSGTTGSPKRVFFTAADQELTVDFFHHGMTTFTDPGDCVLICMPGGTEGSVGDLLRKGLDRFGCRSVVYGPIRNYMDALAVIKHERITGIVGIPSQIITLARLSEHLPDRPALKSVLLSADYVPLMAADAISRIWSAAVYGHYGLTETGLGGGVECTARAGYHLREADLLFEVVDPLSGLPVPDGQYGEVVFTTLTRRGMPLIRYRTGDRARFLTQDCPCGTVLRRLDRVTNRLAEPRPLTDGGTLSVTQLDEIIYGEPSAAAYDAALLTDNGRDLLRITVMPSGAAADLAGITERLQTALPGLFQRGGLLLDVRPGDIEYFTTGTLKRSISDHRSSLKDGSLS